MQCLFSSSLYYACLEQSLLEFYKGLPDVTVIADSTLKISDFDFLFFFCLFLSALCDIVDAGLYKSPIYAYCGFWALQINYLSISS